MGCSRHNTSRIAADQASGQNPSVGLSYHVSLRRMDGLQVLREEGQERAEGRRLVGCSACIKKLQRHDNGPWPATLTVIAEGASPLLFSGPSFGCCTPACLCRTQSLSAFSSLQNHHSQSSFEQGLMSHMLCPLLKSSCSPSGVINAH